MIVLRKRLSQILIWFTQIFGTKLRDKDGNVLCRAFLWSWRGRLHVIGLPRDVQLRSVPLSTSRLTYWVQSTSWELAQPPDFPSLLPEVATTGKRLVCHVVICHLSAPVTTRIIDYWKSKDPGNLVILAYGGSREEFDTLPGSLNAIYITDPNLRTFDHVRQRQQYSHVLLAASEWIALNSSEVTHVHVVEFDAIPLSPHLGDRLVDSLETSQADLMGYGLVDISGTIHPHYSHEYNNSKFMQFLADTSKRETKDRLLSMLGCSSIWTRKCFDNVATHLQQPQVYLEIGIPTSAHHLGYRVRPMPASQAPYVSFEGDLTRLIPRFSLEKAWLVHPCKEYWNTEQIPAANPASLSATKLRLLLIGHTYSAVANRKKADALAKWFDVMVIAPDLSGVTIMGKDGSAQDGDTQAPSFAFRRLERWPQTAKFTQILLKNLGSHVREWRPDIVLCEAEPWSLLRWQCRITSWLCFRRIKFFEFTWENLPRPGIRGILLRFIYQLAGITTNGVICGNLGAEKLFTAAGLDRTKILRTGQLGVEPPEHPIVPQQTKTAWKQNLGLDPESFVVGFCGRFVEEKGILDLFQAATLAKEKHPNLALVYLGAGPLESMLREYAEKSPWVKLLPPVSHAEVPAIISNFDLFVLPSKPQLDPTKGIWEEQFGHVLIEAMMSQVPCIGSRSGGIPEVIEDENLLFNPGDVIALRNLLLVFCENRTFVSETASRQRKTTLQKWSHEALAAQYAGYVHSFLPKDAP